MVYPEGLLSCLLEKIGFLVTESLPPSSEAKKSLKIEQNYITAVDVNTCEGLSNVW